jgi:hypothetical protein
MDRGRPAGLVKGTILALGIFAVLEAAGFLLLLRGSAASAVFFLAGLAVGHGFQRWSRRRWAEHDPERARRSQ